jgi:hypothetical protein
LVFPYARRFPLTIFIPLVSNFHSPPPSLSPSPVTTFPSSSQSCSPLNKHPLSTPIFPVNLPHAAVAKPVVTAVSGSAAAPLSPARHQEALTDDALTIQPHCLALAQLATKRIGVAEEAVMKELAGEGCSVCCEVVGGCWAVVCSMRR